MGFQDVLHFSEPKTWQKLREKKKKKNRWSCQSAKSDSKVAPDRFDWLVASREKQEQKVSKLFGWTVFGFLGSVFLV